MCFKFREMARHRMCSIFFYSWNLFKITLVSPPDSSLQPFLPLHTHRGVLVARIASIGIHYRPVINSFNYHFLFYLSLSFPPSLSPSSMLFFNPDPAAGVITAKYWIFHMVHSPTHPTGWRSQWMALGGNNYPAARRKRSSCSDSERETER